ncbi:MAG TPA: phosphoenolpyruvate carboxylase [Kofleriaceae bacterium]|nr:phosphoenolpyruvate carboxylase [Kofleriaceae bacterium]
MHDPALLERDLARLSDALLGSARTLGGAPMQELRARLVGAARELRVGDYPGGRRAFAEQIGQLSEDELEEVARTEALWCHLMNIAEERQRLRVLRARGDHAPDGLAAALDAVIDQGVTADELRAMFDRALVMPVITAHPSEARRRTTLDHLGRIGALLDEVDHAGDRARTHARLEAEVLAFHATEDARARRPTPLDEVEHSLEVFRRSLLDVTPRIYRTMEDRLAARFGGTWRLPTLFRWGTWIGGDRDGNPNVTAAITRGAFARQRAAIVNRYLDDLVVLGRSLSVSALRARGDLSELEAALERDRQLLPEVAARARPRAPNEPWREKLWYVQARLLATLDARDEGYLDAEVYHDDLALLDRSLRATGFAAVADQDLRDAMRRADVFGFHLASLDVRQHSGVHDRVVAELLARGGRPGYLERDEAGRRALLGEVLARPITPERDQRGMSPELQESLETLEVVGRARRMLGPRACERYVISFTREVSDLLEVVFLARAAGLAPGELRPVPLLEQLEDLERAGTIARDCLADDALHRELGGELEVMVGYSDSGKQVGYVASSVALRTAQIELAAAADRAGVMLTVFHGRGGSLGRGGGPESDAIRAQPAVAVRGRLRVTEQGETVTARYAQPEIAERDLEQTFAAVLAATFDRHNHDERPTDERALHDAAEAARSSYLALTRDEDRLARYTIAATPIEDVAHLPLGSRPASRKGGITLDALRAIPWVFSWTQSRHGIPGWFSVGTAVHALAERLGVDGVRELAGRSRFFRALIRNCELSLVRSDIDVAREYARLADPEAAQVFTLIEAEHARTVAALHDILGITTPLATRPYLAASIVRRNSTLDLLSHVQIEALRRRRGGAADPDRLGRIIATTIGGIAAGLQTAG